MLGTRFRNVAVMLWIGALVAASTPAVASNGGTGKPPGHNGYVNPFKAARWYAGRIDMGVDYVPRGKHAVVAIGDAKILGSDSRSGWPGGHFIWYKLTDGDHRGDIIYVAEQLKKLAPKGERVDAGEPIATALPSSSGLEIGWANRRGETRAAPCYREGMKTHSGREMARFLKSLGAKTGDRPGRVPNHPSGKRC